MTTIPSGNFCLGRLLTMGSRRQPACRVPEKAQTASGPVSRFPRVQVLIVAAVLVAACCVVPVQAEIRPEFAMDDDPRIVVPPPEMRVSDKFAPLWLEALNRPEADFQRMLAEAFTEGQAAGLPGMRKAIPVFEKLVTSESMNPATRLAIARALIKFDARDSAPALFDVSKHSGADFRNLIEPALARWKFAPIREIWQARIQSPDTSFRDLMLAINGLAAIGDSADVAGLLAIVNEPFRVQPIRLAAARAAGQIQESGLEDDASRLLKPAQAAIHRRLCAVALLARHDSPNTRALLLAQAVDPEPTVAAAALERLNAIDHNLVLSLAEKAMENPDQHVREQGLECFVALPTPERVFVVSRRLNDPHPAIRAKTREAMFLMAAQPELNDSVRASAINVLSGNDWRGQQQSSLLLAALDQKSVAPRLVELLESERGEVAVASAWGLRQLAVPETLPAILDKATRQTEFRRSGVRSADHLDLQVAHLFEAIGIMKYAPSEPLLKRYIPKDFSYGNESRAAAIWALGYIHEGTPDEQLAEQFTGRLTDPSTSPPEMDRVRTMSAISLGRMKAVSQVKAIKAFMGPNVIPLPSSLAMRWAIRELTGEELPDPEPSITSKGNFFLEPLDIRLEELVPVER